MEHDFDLVGSDGSFSGQPGDNITEARRLPRQRERGTGVLPRGISYLNNDE